MTASACWASELGDCDAKITGEHVISRSVTSPSIRVSGLPWTGDTPRQISAASFTANVLCRRHNSELSPVDAAAAEASSQLRGLFDAPAPAKLLINGLLLERWVLKTAINAYYGQKMPFGPGGTPIERPPKWLVQVAFGRIPWPAGLGLLICTFDQKFQVIEQSVELSPVFSASGSIVGTLCVFLGLRMLELWGPAPPDRLGKTAEKALKDSRCHFHLPDLHFDSPNGVTTVAFDWGSPNPSLQRTLPGRSPGQRR